MKISDFLKEHPELDQELNEEEGSLYLDVVFLFRVLAADGEMGEANINIASSQHTDGVVKRGLIQAANQVMSTGWGRSDDN